MNMSMFWTGKLNRDLLETLQKDLRFFSKEPSLEKLRQKKNIYKKGLNIDHKRSWEKEEEKTKKRIGMHVKLLVKNNIEIELHLVKGHMIVGGVVGKSMVV